MLIFNKYILPWFILVPGLLSSCLPPDPTIDLSVEEKDVYVTNRDYSVNFANYKTYFIVDSVKAVTKTDSAVSQTVSSAPLILGTINSELQKDGFTQVSTPQTADVGIAVTVLRFSQQTPVQYFPYLAYNGYPSPAIFGFPTYGFTLPAYYGYYEIDVGSIAIEMYDLKTARSSNKHKINAIWDAVLAGSLTDSTSGDNNQRIINAITGAFNQSPYLKEGK